jgi:hypothetical protein
VVVSELAEVSLASGVELLAMAAVRSVLAEVSLASGAAE